MTRLLLALPLFLFACGGGAGASQEDVDAVMALPGDDNPGETLYLDNCAVCHLDDGSGDIGPSLIFHVSKHPDEYLVGLIIDGSGAMPAFDDLSDQQIADLLAYLRLTFGEF